jgi:hypothetical protein
MRVDINIMTAAVPDDPTVALQPRRYFFRFVSRADFGMTAGNWCVNKYTLCTLSTTGPRVQ